METYNVRSIKKVSDCYFCNGKNVQGLEFIATNIKTAVLQHRRFACVNCMFKMKFFKGFM